MGIGPILLRAFRSLRCGLIRLFLVLWVLGGVSIATVVAMVDTDMRIYVGLMHASMDGGREG